MKKIKYLLVMALMLLGVSSLYAITPKEQAFVGKWVVNVSGLPQDSVKLDLNIADKNGKLDVSVAMGGQQLDVSAVSVTDSTITFYIDSDENSVEFSADLIDKDTLKGTIMDRFDLTGKRVKKE